MTILWEALKEGVLPSSASPPMEIPPKVRIGAEKSCMVDVPRRDGHWCCTAVADHAPLPHVAYGLANKIYCVWDDE